ncbi:MAG: transcription elongation factor GreA [Nitrospirae bacterium RIFCSPLOW2_12_42_9]|nr:MAG: transcription elongation factor GreA [Nitrospirae bacterium GWA2_42_11]OGW57269.1 MAG: transcription elongation factor GreA [Nitrospirae bacterium RIFCSPLOW2_12_42_9]OGW58266.1 MAG: transcription elongation factor GreA [Nitrospirae bacterium RIFCSPHIGHO2_02_FULL_42_12]HAS17825.1 transcription elongation factor GreA [Nitrospiraceae bacterium]HBI23085.1 transcription elongation factor GreA [Nitrospiraceae bacterium]
MTKEGFLKLQEERDKLRKIERPQNIKDIAEARAHGDLSENAEYHAAKERQSFLEGKIRDIEYKIATAEIIDITSINTDKVVFGATVQLLDMSKGEAKKYKIVGEDEVDLKNGKISLNSPVGRALIGNKIGAIVTIKAPAGDREYEIQGISFEG